ncbi:MAG: GEVED domain-containing protein, partial [Candidatus Zixiibacteriota bacterium]
TPPPEALPGPTRMRVRIVDTAVDPLDPCGSTSWGEVEDYTIIVSGEVPICAVDPDPTPVLVKFAIDYVEGAVYFTSDAVGGDLNDVTLSHLQPQGSSCTVPFDSYEIVPEGYGDLPGPVGKGTFDLREYVVCEEEDGLVWGSFDSFFDVYYELASTPGSFSCSVGMIGHTPGDLNLDGSVNVSDLTYLVNFLFRDGPAPLVMEVADVDASGSVNVSDVTYLVNYLFRNGPAPTHP